MERQPCKYLAQRFIIFSLEPLAQNNDPKYAAVTGGLSQAEIGFWMNDQTVYISSKFPRFKFSLTETEMRAAVIHFTCSNTHTHTHSRFHLNAAREFTACNGSKCYKPSQNLFSHLKTVYFCFLRFSGFLLGCSLVPNQNVSPSGC